MFNAFHLSQSDADVIASLDDEYGYIARYETETAAFVDTYETVKQALNERLMLAQKYDIPEYREECARLLEKLHALRHAGRDKETAHALYTR